MRKLPGKGRLPRLSGSKEKQSVCVTRSQESRTWMEERKKEEKVEQWSRNSLLEEKKFG